jgi:hypothetical protein
MLLRIIGLLGISIIRYSKNYKTQRFVNWNCFHPQVTEVTRTLLGSLEKANFNQWITHIRFTLAIQIPETQLCRREIIGKYATKIAMKQAIVDVTGVVQ